MKDVVYRPFQLQRMRNVVADEHEAVVRAQVLDIGTAAGNEVVNADNLMPFREKALAKVRTDEAGTSRDNCPHTGDSIGDGTPKSQRTG